jgi:hypothetical protein
MVAKWIELIHPEVVATTEWEAQAYLVGAAHDACFNSLHKTTRFSQRDDRWLGVLDLLLSKLGHSRWEYQEGNRGVHVLETGWKPPPLILRTDRETSAYVRGYFDAEGGIPRRTEDRFYIQFVQKDWWDLKELRSLCVRLGMSCGQLHNPSKRVDPSYWRFYIGSESHNDFLHIVGSWHPTKRLLLEERKVSLCRESQNRMKLAIE